MTMEETAKLITYISTIWPKTFQGIKGGEAAVVKTWADLLEDIPAGAALAAVRAHATTSDWAPSIKNIREAYMMTDGGQTWLQCYQNIMTAVRRFGWYNREDGLDSLDPMARKIADGIGWKALCESDSGDAAIRAHIMKSFEGYSERDRKEKLIPFKVREQLQKLAGGILALKDGAD
jgi:hypothetical protein